ncbi:MAG: glycosyltransferase family 9 protein [Candidatus Marinimicrobia bacterium]|nr:glycosyltransferase family 9 protein [Candidatus Neomarinimicrobiota bacterium]
MTIQYNCRHFNGYIPCAPHKEKCVECNEQCKFYDKTECNILIIKLGAMGDVVRTTPLLHRIKKEFPTAKIFWFTEYPSVVPVDVDVILPYNAKSLEWIKATHFEWGVNLDKDPDACSIFKNCDVKERYGFILENGVPTPVNELSHHKFLTGISDTISQKNTKHYMQEIFEICGWDFDREEYILPKMVVNQSVSNSHFSGKVIGLNTGCGGRWKTRLWPEENWTKLIISLQQKGYDVVVLGGPEEDEKNIQLAAKTHAKYFGVIPILEFLYLMSKCNAIITAVTMAMHFAIGLKIPLVLFNNIFNPNEFYFYTKSEIVSPDTGCECYYTPECKRENPCMNDITADQTLAVIEKLLK